MERAGSIPALSREVSTPRIPRTVTLKHWDFKLGEMVRISYRAIPVRSVMTAKA
eukprot:jgi/Bigna1/59636/fgenesh1_kg.5_\